MTDENLPPWVEPDTTIATRDTETGAGGLTAHKNDRAFMLNVRPAKGSGWLIPYSRIDGVEVNEEATLLTIYSSVCLATIKGQNLDAIIIAIQRGVAWSLHVGQSTSNEAHIDEIHVTLPIDDNG